jgi:hypothetical protein
MSKVHCVSAGAVKCTDADGVDVFYLSAGVVDATVMLHLHGFPRLRITMGDDPASGRDVPRERTRPAGLRIHECAD